MSFYSLRSYLTTPYKAKGQGVVLGTVLTNGISFTLEIRQKFGVGQESPFVLVTKTNIGAIGINIKINYLDQNSAAQSVTLTVSPNLPKGYPILNTSQLFISELTSVETVDSNRGSVGEQLDVVGLYGNLSKLMMTLASEYSEILMYLNQVRDQRYLASMFQYGLDMYGAGLSYPRQSNQTDDDYRSELQRERTLGKGDKFTILDVLQKYASLRFAPYTNSWTTNSQWLLGISTLPDELILGTLTLGYLVSEVYVHRLDHTRTLVEMQAMIDKISPIMTLNRIVRVDYIAQVSIQYLDNFITDTRPQYNNGLTDFLWEGSPNYDVYNVLVSDAVIKTMYKDVTLSLLQAPFRFGCTMFCDVNSRVDAGAAMYFGVGIKFASYYIMIGFGIQDTLGSVVMAQIDATTRNIPDGSRTYTALTWNAGEWNWLAGYIYWSGTDLMLQLQYSLNDPTKTKPSVWTNIGSPITLAQNNGEPCIEEFSAFVWTNFSFNIGVGEVINAKLDTLFIDQLNP